MIRIFLIGYMGCGKTTIGRTLAEKLNYEFVDLDHSIENKFHKTVSQIFEDLGQDEFRKIERDVLREVADFENVVIATGGGAPCFFDNMEVMNSKGFTVYIELTPEQLTERLENSREGKRPLLAGRKGEELKNFILEGLTARERFYLQAKCVVSGNDEQIVEHIAGKYIQNKQKISEE